MTWSPTCGMTDLGIKTFMIRQVSQCEDVYEERVLMPQVGELTDGYVGYHQPHDKVITQRRKKAGGVFGVGSMSYIQSEDLWKHKPSNQKGGFATSMISSGGSGKY